MATIQWFDSAFDAGLGYATHSGAMFANRPDGLNYQVGARFMLTEAKYVRLGVRHQVLGHETANVSLPSGEYTRVKFDLSLREYMFLIGRIGQGKSHARVRSPGYFEFGASFMQQRVSTTEFGGDSDSETSLGALLQGGMLVLLGDHFALDMSAGLTWKLGAASDTGRGLLMGVHAGIVWLH